MWSRDKSSIKYPARYIDRGVRSLTIAPETPKMVPYELSSEKLCLNVLKETADNTIIKFSINNRKQNR